MTFEIPTITSAQNRQVSRIRRLLAKPRDCRREGVLVADGIHLVREALAARLPGQAIFAEVDSRSAEILALIESARAQEITVYPVVPHIFRAISAVETPQGIVGIFERPKETTGSVPRPELLAPRDLVVLAGVQDPMNLGSIVRSASAAGVREITCTDHSVDPFHHRALRASQGAAFHMPVRIESSARAVSSRLAGLGYLSIGLSPRGEVSLTSLDPRASYALFFGSEGEGLDPETERSLALRVRIPMEGATESLGVAAAAAVTLFWLSLERGR